MCYSNIYHRHFMLSHRAIYYFFERFDYFMVCYAIKAFITWRSEQECYPPVAAPRGGGGGAGGNCPPYDFFFFFFFFFFACQLSGRSWP